ncbi:hypothetical protein A9Q86_11860 [Flavobacteriales bacterium 33_180_T64]|nr:hypothetical protein A9Q86_11860 [Flavobacteriales bacterium 33_180_T64]
MKYEFEHCIGSRLRQISRLVDNIFRSALADFDVTENQMTILFVVSKFENVEQGVIGQVLSLERSTVSRNVKMLSNKGYISKSLDYRPLISLSKDGVILVNKLIPIWEDTMSLLTDKLGPKGISNLNELEQKIK